MPHLDEGTIHALLDGEIPSAELPPIQAHLGACAECRARLAGEQELLDTSDRLIELIEVPALSPIAAPGATGIRRRTWPRKLAWAATVVLAAGLGYSARGSMSARPMSEVRAPETLLLRAPEPAAPAEVAPALSDAPRPEGKTRQSDVAKVLSNPGDRRAGVAVHEEARKATDTRERVAARDSVGAASVAAGTSLSAAAPPAAQKAESLARPPAAPSPALGQLNQARRLDPAPNRLEEVVVTGVGDRAAKLSSLTTPVPVTFSDAVRKLGGSLRLIEGLIPERLESLGSAVRVVYATGFGELMLSQQLENGKVRHILIAPRGFPADSVEKLRARVRD